MIDIIASNGARGALPTPWDGQKLDKQGAVEVLGTQPPTPSCQLAP